MIPTGVAALLAADNAALASLEAALDPLPAGADPAGESPTPPMPDAAPAPAAAPPADAGLAQKMAGLAVAAELARRIDAGPATAATVAAAPPAPAARRSPVGGSGAAIELQAPRWPRDARIEPGELASRCRDAIVDAIRDAARHAAAMPDMPASPPASAGEPPTRLRIAVDDERCAGYRDGRPLHPAWSVQIDLELPRLGAVAASVRIVGQAVAVRVVAASATPLRAELAELRSRLAAAGLDPVAISAEPPDRPSGGPR